MPRCDFIIHLLFPQRITKDLKRALKLIKTSCFSKGRQKNVFECSLFNEELKVVMVRMSRHIKVTVSNDRLMPQGHKRMFGNTEVFGDEGSYGKFKF